jgi:hypothetical protein
MTLGADTVYEVLYSDTGLHYGARLIESPGVVEGCLRDLEALFARGEDFTIYFNRHIAPLPPPVTRRSRGGLLDRRRIAS